MNFLYLLLSVVGESGGYAIDKLNFQKNKITIRQSMFLAFLIMSGCMLVFIVLSGQALPQFSYLSLGLVALIVAISFGANALDYASLKINDLSLREPLLDFQPVLAGLIAYMLYPDERRLIDLIAFALATLVVYRGMHGIRLRKAQREGMVYLLLCVVLYALLPSLYKLSLSYLPPAYLALLRVLGIFVLSIIFMPVKRMKGFTSKKILYALASGVVCSISAIASLYAIEAYGVVITMLFFMLGPALRYLAGQFIFKEKVRRVEVISSLLLTLIVAVTAFAH